MGACFSKNNEAEVGYESASKTIMVVTSSPLGDFSASTTVVNAFVEAYVAAHPGVAVDLVDCNTLPLFTAARVQSKFKLYEGADKPDNDSEWAETKDLIARFVACEAIVIGAPMWNFDIPGSLKLFFDHVVQPNKTFDPANLQGLVKGKPCFIVRSSSGVDVGGPMDAGSRYLNLIFGFMGFTHVEIMGVQVADQAEKESILAVKKDAAAAAAANFAFDPTKVPEPAAPTEASEESSSSTPLVAGCKVLYVSSSPMGDYSASRKVCDALLSDIKANVEGVTVTTLDLAAMTADGSLQPYTAKRVMAKFATFGKQAKLDTAEAMCSAGLDDATAAEWAETQALIKQFEEHNVYIFGVPVWNLHIPFHLKNYLDHIIQPHQTFDPATYQGMLSGKRAIVVCTAGSPTLGTPFDACQPYMKQSLGFIGVTDRSFVAVNGTASPAGPEAIDAGIKSAKAAVGLL